MIGILALQGAFSKHKQCLESLGLDCKLIKHPHELENCYGLIIPGGETTTHQKLLTEEFWGALERFGESKPIFGTCCGLILLSKKVYNQNIRTLKLIDIVSDRNAYGRQVESFATTLEIDLSGSKEPLEACFIRAPKILEASKDVSVLAFYQNDPVAVEQGLHIACTFHPELCQDFKLHNYFFQKCLKAHQMSLS